MTRRPLLEHPALPWVMLAAIPLVWLPYLINWRLGANADASITYLMARHVLAGELPAYFWGHLHYGPHEAYLGAGLMRLFGSSHVVVVDLVCLLAYLGAGLLLVRCAPAGQRLVRAFLALAAPSALFVAVVRPGFSQGTLLWLGLAALIALAPGLRPDPSSPSAWVRAAAAGLVLAATQLLVSTIMLGAAALGLVVLLFVAAERRGAGTTRRAAVRLAQLVLTLGLWQLHRLVRAPAPGGGLGELLAGPDQIGQKLPLLAEALLQFSPVGERGVTTSGLFTFYTGHPPAHYPGLDAATPLATPGTVLLAALVACVALAGAALILGRAWRAFFGRGPDDRPTLQPEPLYWCLLLLGGAAAFLLHPAVLDQGSARYVTYLFFPLVACSGVSLAALRLRRARWIKPALAVGWAAAVAVGHLQVLGVEDRINADLDATVAYLRQQGVRGGLANYWLSYNVIALTGEELIFVPLAHDRYPAYRARPARLARVATLQFLRRAALGKLVRLPRGQYSLVERKVFGEVVATVYARRGATSARPPPRRR